VNDRHPGAKESLPLKSTGEKELNERFGRRVKESKKGGEKREAERERARPRTETGHGTKPYFFFATRTSENNIE